MIRRIALFLLCGAFGIGAYILLDTWSFFKSSPEKKMQRLWEEDTEALRDAKVLPPQWDSIREVRYNAHDPEAVKMIKKLEVPVRLKKDGDYRLDILFVPWSEDGKTGAFIQYDLVDLKSPNENTIWEKSRTLIISDKNYWLEKWMDGKFELPKFRPD